MLMLFTEGFPDVFPVRRWNLNTLIRLIYLGFESAVSASGICVTHQGTIGDERDGRFDTMIENVNFGRSKIKSDQRCSEYDKGIQRL